MIVTGEPAKTSRTDIDENAKCREERLYIDLAKARLKASVSIIGVGAGDEIQNKVDVLKWLGGCPRRIERQGEKRHDNHRRAY